MFLLSILFFDFFFFFSDVNCGGDGTNFLYFPPEIISSCTTYEWEAIVSFESDDDILDITVPLCSVELISPPVGKIYIDIIFNLLFLFLLIFLTN